MRTFILFLLGMLILQTACQKDDEDNHPYTGLDRNLMLNLVNEKRAEGCDCGASAMPPVDPVQWDDNLASAAYKHSIDMNENDYFDHESLDGRTFSDRINESGFDGNPQSENIAWGYGSEEAVVEGWINSEGHCKNIMRATSTHIGVGRSGDYWTMVFGKK